MGGSRPVRAVIALLVPAVVTLVTSGTGSVAAAPDTLKPSRQIQVGPLSCTLGFVFAGGDGLAQATTAGHCGKVGSAVTAGGIKVGTIVDVGPGEVDIARIDIQTSMRVYADVDGIGIVDNVIGPDVLNQQRPLLCKKGAESGLSCGPLVGRATASYFTFAAKAEHGDSGAPVYALTREGKLLAVGILEGSQKDRPDIAVVTMLEPFMSLWRLKVSR